MTTRRLMSLVCAIILVLTSSLSLTSCDKKTVATATNASAGVRIKWDSVAGADEYEIYKQNGKSWDIMTKTSECEFVDSKAKNGTEITYKICSVKNGKSKNLTKVVADYLAPVEIKNVDIAETGITITWDAFDTAKSYEIFRSVGDGKKESVAKIKDTTYTDTAIEIGNVYSYSVRQIASHAQSGLPEGVAVSLNGKVDSAKVKNSPNGIVVSWSAESNVGNGYNIYRKIDNGEWVSVGKAAIEDRKFVDKDNKEFAKKITYKVCVDLGLTEGEGVETESIYAVDVSKKLIALTYDDGPYGPVTNSLLDTMEKYNSRCTFFIVGERVEWYPSCLERASSLGCECASHTYNHKYLSKISDAEIEPQLTKAKAIIEKYSGTECRLLRPPGGYDTPKAKMPQIEWDVDTKDWSNRNADTTLANAKRGIHDGAIVLMHDLYPSSAEATKKLVPYLIENGYQLVTVSELFDAKGIELKDGVDYFSAVK